MERSLLKSIWYPFNWERWIDKKQHHRHADIGVLPEGIATTSHIAAKAWDEYPEACSMTDISELAQRI
jgi:hypothetical protein